MQQNDKETVVAATAKPKSERWVGQSLVNVDPTLSPRAKIIVVLRELINGGLRGLLLGYSAKTAIALLMLSIGKGGGKRAVPGNTNGKAAVSSIGERLWAALSSRDSIQFSLFLGLFNGLFRGSNAGLALVRGVNDQLNALVAGAIAGLASAVDHKERRAGLALVLIVRATDLFVRRLVRRGHLPFWKHSTSLLFGICNIPIMYGFLYEPDILARSYYNWILWASDVTNQRFEDSLRCGCGHYHDGPCVKYLVRDWIINHARFSTMYAPVHLVPLLAFRWQRVLADPSAQVVRVARAILASCSFLSTYVTLVKATTCGMGHVTGKEQGWHGAMAGLFTGLSCGFEQPGRVSELMLYCVPRSLEAAYTFLQKRNLVQRVKGWDIGLFVVASAIVMASAQEDFKPLFYQALNFGVGSGKSEKKSEKEVVGGKSKLRVE